MLVKKVFKTPIGYFDRRKNSELLNNLCDVGYVNINGFMIGNKTVGLFRTNGYKGHGSCFYLHSDNFAEKTTTFLCETLPTKML